ncbi:MAG: HAMP domain-containing sensor histidine kinase [Acidimicrobiia bacterium]
MTIRLPLAELDIVSAVPVPVLVADYTPIIERFDGMDGETLRHLLRTDEALLMEVLSLPRTVAASPEWNRLYGSPLVPDPPDFAARSFTSARYPDLFNTLIEQYTAPFFGTTSIISEHTAPTMFGDVVVRSHWKAVTDENNPRWDRIVIMDLDVTDLRMAQHDLEALLSDKQKLVESKDQLIASVSHEIRTPLSSIVGFAHLLNEKNSDLSPAERKEMIELVVQQSGDLTNIVDDLLVAAKADIGQLVVSSVPVDLRAQAAQAVEGLDAESRRAVKLNTTTARCVGDPARVRQIVRNLVSNAVKHGGPTISVDAVVGPDVGRLMVCDDGPGIPETHREMIFEAYHRGDGPPSGLAPSLGLGLHISRFLAKRMGGDVTYRYDGRSTFEFTLPLAAKQ